MIYCLFSCIGLLLDISQTCFICISECENIYLWTGKLIDFIGNTELSGALSNCFSYFTAFFFLLQSLNAPVILYFLIFLKIEAWTILYGL